jgi:hypothetical protein
MLPLNAYVAWRERSAIDRLGAQWITGGRFIGTFGGLWKRNSYVVAGIVTGLTETSTGIGGPPLALLYQHQPPPVLRSTIAFCFLIGEPMNSIRKPRDTSMGNSWLAALRAKVEKSLQDFSGHTWGGCCELSYVWVHERHRGRGLGALLLRSAEAEAVARGCVQVVLATHSFQAPAFYERMGYQRRHTIEGRPTARLQLPTSRSRGPCRPTHVEPPPQRVVHDQ